MIHLNIGSNLNSNFGTRFDNITIAINILINSKLKILRISNFYETPSYPNQTHPKFLNVGILVNFDKNCNELIKKIKLIEKKMGRLNRLESSRATPHGQMAHIYVARSLDCLPKSSRQQ